MYYYMSLHHTNYAPTSVTNLKTLTHHCAFYSWFSRPSLHVVVPVAGIFSFIKPSWINFPHILSNSFHGPHPPIIILNHKTHICHLWLRGIRNVSFSALDTWNNLQMKIKKHFLVSQSKFKSSASVPVCNVSQPCWHWLRLFCNLYTQQAFKL